MTGDNISESKREQPASYTPAVESLQKLIERALAATLPDSEKRKITNLKRAFNNFDGTLGMTSLELLKRAYALPNTGLSKIIRNRVALLQRLIELSKTEALASVENQDTSSDPYTTCETLMSLMQQLDVAEARKSKALIPELELGEDFYIKAMEIACTQIELNPEINARLAKIVAAVVEFRETFTIGYDKFQASMKEFQEDPIVIRNLMPLLECAKLMGSLLDLKAKAFDENCSIPDLARPAYNEGLKIASSIISAPVLNTEEIISLTNMTSGVAKLANNILDIDARTEFTQAYNKAPLYKTNNWKIFGAIAACIIGVALMAIGFGPAAAAIAPVSFVAKWKLVGGAILLLSGAAWGCEQYSNYSSRGKFTESVSPTGEYGRTAKKIISFFPRGSAELKGAAGSPAPGDESDDDVNRPAGLGLIRDN